MGVGPEARGKGFGTEAVSAAIRWGDAHFASSRTVCLIDTDNFRSIRLGDKCGYERTEPQSSTRAPRCSSLETGSVTNEAYARARRREIASWSLGEVVGKVPIRKQEVDMHRATKVRLLMATLLAAMLAGCSQSTAPAGVVCPALALPAPLLVYPVSGSTNVPVGIGTIVVSPPLLGGSYVAVLSGGPAPVQSSPFGAAPSPLPSPITTPAGPNPQYASATVPPLLHSTTYTVTYAAASPQPCGSLYSGSGGTFTTQ